MSRQRIILVTLGIMLSLFMASMEVTVVATAIPTIVGNLGGLAIYSWVFSAFMLASTTTVPIFGKLSDIYGRRPVYGAAMALFLIGSFLCGAAQSMPQLIAFRAVQGLGAGGIIPLAFTLIGGALGVSVMGAVLSFRLASRLVEAGLDAATISIDSLLDPVTQATTSLVLEDTLRNALAGAIQSVFVIAFIAAALGLVATTFAPGGRIDQLVAQRAGAKSAGQPARTSASGK